MKRTHLAVLLLSLALIGTLAISGANGAPAESSASFSLAAVAAPQAPASDNPLARNLRWRNSVFSHALHKFCFCNRVTVLR